MIPRNTLLASVTLGFCLVLSFLAPTAASATWGFSMGEDGGYPVGNQHANFTKIEFFIADVPQNVGITWSDNGVSNFSNTLWSADKINQTYVVATGPAMTGSLFWDFLFTGTAPKKNFRLDYLVYTNSNSPAFGISMSIDKGVPKFNPSGWTSLNLNNLPSYNRSPVAAPVPPSVFLLGPGLIGVVALRKKVCR